MKILNNFLSVVGELDSPFFVRLVGVETDMDSHHFSNLNYISHYHSYSCLHPTGREQTEILYSIGMFESKSRGLIRNPPILWHFPFWRKVSKNCIFIWFIAGKGRFPLLCHKLQCSPQGIKGLNGTFSSWHWSEGLNLYIQLISSLNIPGMCYTAGLGI